MSRARVSSRVLLLIVALMLLISANSGDDASATPEASEANESDRVRKPRGLPFWLAIGVGLATMAALYLLSPTDPDCVELYGDSAEEALADGDWETGIEKERQYAECIGDSDYGYDPARAHLNIATALWHLDRNPESAAEAQMAIDLLEGDDSNDALWLTLLGMSLRGQSLIESGHPDDADEVFREIVRNYSEAPGDSVVDRVAVAQARLIGPRILLYADFENGPIPFETGSGSISMFSVSDGRYVMAMNGQGEGDDTASTFGWFGGLVDASAKEFVIGVPSLTAVVEIADIVDQGPLDGIGVGCVTTAEDGYVAAVNGRRDVEFMVVERGARDGEVIERFDSTAPLETLKQIAITCDVTDFNQVSLTASVNGIEVASGIYTAQVAITEFTGVELRLTAPHALPWTAQIETVEAHLPEGTEFP